MTTQGTNNVAKRSSQTTCKKKWYESLDDSFGCSVLIVLVVVVGAAEVWGDGTYVEAP
jgi:hypothetical protein